VDIRSVRYSFEPHFESISFDFQPGLAILYQSWKTNGKLRNMRNQTVLKKWSWLLLLGFAGVLALTACRSTQDNPNTPEQPKTSEHPQTSEHPK